jgi:hypothetical protein
MQMIERQQETREQATRRLADQARRSGVRICRDRRDGRHYASSVSHPGEWHYVTALSCDCRGFVTHQRCQHHSALLAALGWINDEDPDPEPPVPATSPGSSACHECFDSGYTRVYYGGGLSDWVAAPCTACDATSTLRRAA